MSGLRSTAFRERAVLPGIRSLDGPFEDIQNDFLFQIRPVDMNVGTDDSVIVDQAGDVLDVVVALLLAAEVQNRSELRNPKKAEQLKKTIAEKLFTTYSEGMNVLHFDPDGNLSVSRSELRRYLLAVQASRAAAQAA